MASKRTRVSRLTRWAAFIIVGAFIVVACRPDEPELTPTAVPVTAEPSTVPISASAEPTPEPTPEPTAEPTPEPTPEPTAEPTPMPTPEPTAAPTLAPTVAPTAEPVASDTPVGAPVVTGQTVLPEGAFIDVGATITARVEDTSLQDVGATVIGESVTTDPEIAADGTIPFEVEYDPTAVQEGLTFSMRVRIEDEAGMLLFINDTFTPVITNGAPTSDVEVVVIEIGAPPDVAPVTEDDDMAEEEAPASPAA